MSGDEQQQEQGKGKGKRASRNPNPISPYTRILTLRGIEGIKQLYNEAVAKSVAEERIVPLANLKHIEIPALQALQVTQGPVQVTCRVLPGESCTYPTRKVIDLPLLISAGWLTPNTGTVQLRSRSENPGENLR